MLQRWCGLRCCTYAGRVWGNRHSFTYIFARIYTFIHHCLHCLFAMSGTPRSLKASEIGDYCQYSLFMRELTSRVWKSRQRRRIYQLRSWAGISCLAIGLELFSPMDCSWAMHIGWKMILPNMRNQCREKRLGAMWMRIRNLSSSLPAVFWILCSFLLT